ncbi:DEAD/DEAH box helicase [Candidatus Trichorickettsia mobilis]|uniref:DEAD/DEAH box helicase n=2 Tax=Candidatus Trichorickettsia mobilis TaxID=1346319 RepID=A0ABZ0UT47_9RICK|nr:DEAD/DEAH box helicase [Candidatus Trichorickettsia mobilis]
MQNFDTLGLPQPLLFSLECMKFNVPTPIQAEAIPPALEGRDILGSAQTGTGKTAAFGIPLVANLLVNTLSSALVLVPTRELAGQVMATLEQLIGKESSIKTSLLIGGDSMSKQFLQLKRRPRLIVGTPGRVNDHLTRNSLTLHNTSFLVLDESDRMLDMGFGIQLDKIAKFLPLQRQTLMFSATLPANIVKLSEKYLKQPVRVSVGSTIIPAANITQEVINTTETDKYQQLLKQLDIREGSILVFVKTKHGAEKLAVKLRGDQHSADAIHGDLRQNKRERVIHGFRTSKYRIMVATDIAARGLDIPHIAHVINYDLPQCPEDYIHRVGRTARAGAVGAAVNLITPQDGLKWKAIHRLMHPGEKMERSSISYLTEHKRPSLDRRPKHKRNTGAPRSNAVRSNAPRNNTLRVDASRKYS